MYYAVFHNQSQDTFTTFNILCYAFFTITTCRYDVVEKVDVSKDKVSNILQTFSKAKALYGLESREDGK